MSESDMWREIRRNASNTERLVTVMELSKESMSRMFSIIEKQQADIALLKMAVAKLIQENKK